MDETTCMVDVARFFLNFTRNESCGNARLRIGTTRMLELLEKICAGKGERSRLSNWKIGASREKHEPLRAWADGANPVLTTLRYFRHEYEAHIFEKRCPAGVCKALTTFPSSRLPAPAALCARPTVPCRPLPECAARRGSYVIDEKKCTRCWRLPRGVQIGAVHTR
jgi:hypothetical protein